MTTTLPRPSFSAFYRGDYAADHQHPANLALHALGTVAGLALLAVAALGAISPWWALAFPVVHAVPGLLGHRLFDRNTEVGDLRVLRSDYPGYWFIAANHIMTAGLLLGRRP
jgi:hypothetical protein